MFFSNDLNGVVGLESLAAGGRMFHSVDPATERNRQQYHSRWYSVTGTELLQTTYLDLVTLQHCKVVII